MTTEPTNKDRADEAERTVKRHAKIRGNYDPEDLRAMIIDLLADLRHLCDQEGVHFATLSVTAEAHHRVETAETSGRRT